MHIDVKPAIAEKLILHGANMDAQTTKGLAPLHYPQNYKVTKTLITYGANLNIKDYAPGQGTPLAQSHMWELKARTKLLEDAPKYQEQYKKYIKTRKAIIRIEADKLKMEHEKRIATQKALEQKDKDAIQRALNKAQSKNPKFTEQDLYDRYVQKIFRTTDPIALAAMNRCSDMLKLKLNGPSNCCKR